jgi:hypothetical protein
VPVTIKAEEHRHGDDKTHRHDHTHVRQAG